MTFYQVNLILHKYNILVGYKWVQTSQISELVVIILTHYVQPIFYPFLV